MGQHVFTTSMVLTSDHALHYSIILTIVLKMLDSIAIFHISNGPRADVVVDHDGS